MNHSEPVMVIDGLQYCNYSREIFEQMRAGGVVALHATIAYHELSREVLSRMGHWNRLFENHADLIMPVRSAADITLAKQRGKVGVLFGFQNPSPIEDDIDLVEVFYQLGVRIMQLSYNNQSLLATGCYESHDPGLTRFGKQVIQEMNRVGMVIDMSHSAERSTLEAITHSSRPITISHANPHRWHPGLRNKSDTVIRALGESGGMLGLSLYPFHLKDGPHCTLASFCEMIADTAELMSVDQLGFGSDLCQNHPVSVLKWMRSGRWSKTTDYGEGSANNAGWPAPLPWFASGADFPKLLQGLRDVGFGEEEVRKIAGENWLRFYEQSFSPQPRSPHAPKEPMVSL